MPKDAPSSPNSFPVESDRTALTKAALKRAFRDNLFYEQGKFPALATKKDYYLALAYTVRDRLLHRWVSTAEAYTNEGSRTVAYFSAEFLMGPHLGNNLINLGIYDRVKQAVSELGLDFDALLAEEEEPGLGNGGLGRLAACFLDSLATLEIPTLGYGIRYEYGIFEQEIVDGWQVERTDKWLRFGNPWDLMRPEWAVEVSIRRPHGALPTSGSPRAPVRWVPRAHRHRRSLRHADPRLSRQHMPIPCVCGAPKLPNRSTSRCSTAAIIAARSTRKSSPRTSPRCFTPTTRRCTARSCASSSSTSSCPARCRTCSASSAARKFRIERFHEKFAIQLNDTHPAIAVPELMRLLVDDSRHGVGTSLGHHPKNLQLHQPHPACPRRSSAGRVSMFGRLLPRHLEIIYEINARFLAEARARFPGDAARIARMSLIDENYDHHVRMANLACVGSHDINGVAALHTELLKEDVLSDFNALWPAKFSNKTNGVTPRRWIVLSQSETRRTHLRCHRR